MVRSDTTVVEGWLEDSCWHGPVRVTEMRRFRGFRQQVGWGLGAGGVASGIITLLHCR